MAHHRLFVALRPPRAIRALLLGMQGGVPGARWQSDEQLHLTLRFIGEVDRHRAEDIAAALGTVRHPAFEVSLDGVGRFTDKPRGGAIWAGARPHNALARLHRKIEQALSSAGLAPERRAYLPHVTLARLPRGAGPIEPFLARHASFASPPFAPEHLILFESDLTPEGAAYTPVARYPLV